MNITEFLKKVAYIGEIAGEKVYLTRYDNSCMGKVGEEGVKLYSFLLDHCINRKLQGKDITSVGFSYIEQKWYGWSNNAIRGFGEEEAESLDDAYQMAVDYAAEVA